MTLAETLAAKQAATQEPVVDECLDTEPTPDVEPTPLVTPHAIEVATTQQNPQVLMTNVDEPFLDQLEAASNHPNLQPTPIDHPGAYVAVDSSRRGYQWSGGIIRPDIFGRYVARTYDEAVFLDFLRGEGILVLEDSGSIYPITL